MNLEYFLLHFLWFGLFLLLVEIQYLNWCSYLTLKSNLVKLISQILILSSLNGAYRIEIGLTNGKLDARG